MTIYRGQHGVDEALVDEAVRALNRITVARGLQLARDVGTYVVDTFFGGDLDAVGVQHLSYRALAAREDLLVSHSTLAYSVGVLRQLRELPADIGESLSVSHHRALLPLDVEKKEDLARRAVADGWSVVELRSAVQEERARSRTGERRGRPPLPQLVKSVRGAGRTIQKALETDEVAQLPPDEVATALEEVEALLTSLGAVRERLLARG